MDDLFAYFLLFETTEEFCRIGPLFFEVPRAKKVLIDRFRDEVKIHDCNFDASDIEDIIIVGCSLHAIDYININASDIFNDKKRKNYKVFAEED